MVPEDLQSLRGLESSPTLHLRRRFPHMTSRAGGAAEDAAAVMHVTLNSELTPALRPDPRYPVASACVYMTKQPKKVRPDPHDPVWRRPVYSLAKLTLKKYILGVLGVERSLFRES